MKKTLLAFAAIVAALVSCQKEVSSVSVDKNDLEARDSFVASLDQSTKTTIDNSLQVKWSTDDSISVNGIIYEFEAFAGDDSISAEFTKRYKDQPSPKAPFTACFPAPWFNSDGELAIPDTIIRMNNIDFGMPMQASSNDRTMEFKNICGVLAVRVDSTSMENVQFIQVKENESTVLRTVKCIETVSTRNAPIFYIPLEPNTYDSLNVLASADGQAYNKMHTMSNSGIEIKINTLYAFNYRISLNGITLNKKDIQIIPGKETTLTVTFNPANATNRNLIWKSTMESVATIDSCGKLKAVNLGDAKIIVTSVEGSYKDSCSVKVMTSAEIKDSTAIKSDWYGEFQIDV